jgi:hypothetical protein
MLGEQQELGFLDSKAQHYIHIGKQFGGFLQN